MLFFLCDLWLYLFLLFPGYLFNTLLFLILVYVGGISILILFYSYLMTSSPLEHFNVLGSFISNVNLFYLLSILFILFLNNLLPFSYDFFNSLFVFILGLNLFSICGYSINPFTHLCVSVSLSIIFVFGPFLNNLYYHGLKLSYIYAFRGSFIFNSFSLFNWGYFLFC